MTSSRPKPSENNLSSDSVFRRQRLIRIYLGGFVVMAMLYLTWRVLSELTPWFSGLENPFLAIVLAVLTLLIAPLVLGSLVEFAVNPILGKWNKWAELLSLQDRLIGELTEEFEPRVVMIKGVSEPGYRLGVMTSKIPATHETPVLAAVYFCSAPRANVGWVRLIPFDNLTETGWSVRDYQLFQLTVGSISPGKLFIQEPGPAGYPVER
jgi:uncharacterized membrane protein